MDGRTVGLTGDRRTDKQVWFLYSSQNFVSWA